MRLASGVQTSLGIRAREGIEALRHCRRRPLPNCSLRLACGLAAGGMHRLAPSKLEAGRVYAAGGRCGARCPFAPTWGTIKRRVINFLNVVRLLGHWHISYRCGLFLSAYRMDRARRSSSRGRSRRQLLPSLAPDERRGIHDHGPGGIAINHDFPAHCAGHSPVALPHDRRGRLRRGTDGGRSDWRYL